MPVKHAVLGLLVDASRPLYGSELRRRLDERLGPGFEIPEGTFYTALGTLQRDEHVQEVDRRADGMRERVYFEATGLGRSEFDGWMSEPFAQEAPRGETHLKLAIVERARIPALRTQFQGLERDMVSRIARATSAPDLASEADPAPPAVVVRWLLDSRNLDHLNGELAFVRRTLWALDYLEANGTMPRRKLLEAVSSSG